MIIPNNVLQDVADAYKAMLGDAPALIVPETTYAGEEIVSVKDLAQVMGVPEPIAAMVVIEQNKEQFIDEAKLLRQLFRAVGNAASSAGGGIRRIRSAAGAARYGGNIGDIIRRDAAPDPKPRGRFHFVPRGTLAGRLNGGNGANGGGGGFGPGSGFGLLAGLDFLRGKKRIPPKARKVAEVSGGLGGSRGKAARYVTRLENGEVVTWLVLSVFDRSGNVRKSQTAKVKPGAADKQWRSIVSALKGR